MCLILIMQCHFIDFDLDFEDNITLMDVVD